MATGMDRGVTSDDARRLSSTLRLVGLGKLVLAVLALVLAFTGYDTPRAVNLPGLLVGVNLLVLGGLCLSVGKSFGLASGEPAPPALGEALRKANKLFGYYLLLVALAVVGVGMNTALFLVKILGR